MEEWIGEKWHNYIVGKSSKHFPKAKVELESIKNFLSIFFRIDVAGSLWSRTIISALRISLL